MTGAALPSRRQVELDAAQMQMLRENLGLLEDESQPAAAAALIGIAGGLMVGSHDAVSASATALRALPRTPQLVDFVAQLSRVLASQTPVISATLQARAPSFGRLTHPAGVQALLDGNLDLMAP